MMYAEKLLRMDWFALHEHLEQRQDATFRRLHALMQKGYVPEFHRKECDNIIWLSHPNPSNPELILYSDGMVCSTFATINHSDKEDPTRILNLEPKDDAVFRRFLSGVNPPTWRQRTAQARQRYLWTPLAWGVAIITWLVLVSYWQR